MLSNQFGLSGLLEIQIMTVWSHFTFVFFVFHILNQVSSCFSCLAECCNNILPWSSRSVSGTTRLHLTSHEHDDEDEWIYIFGWTFPLIPDGQLHKIGPTPPWFKQNIMSVSFFGVFILIWTFFRSPKHKSSMMTATSIIKRIYIIHFWYWHTNKLNNLKVLHSSKLARTRSDLQHQHIVP